MSRRPWDLANTEAVFRWCAEEGIQEIRQNDPAKAAKLFRLAADFFDGANILMSDTRSNRWINWRMDVVRYICSDRRGSTGAEELTVEDKTELIHSMELLVQYFQQNLEQRVLGEEWPLPEPFDDTKTIY
jgi:hypothetical protein